MLFFLGGDIREGYFFDDNRFECVFGLCFVNIFGYPLEGDVGFFPFGHHDRYDFKI